MKFDLVLYSVVDEYARENFFRIQTRIESEPILKGQWRFFEITVDSARTNFKYAHNFKFVPKDIIQTSITGAGSLTWNYESFDDVNLDITTTGACVFRGFIGRYAEGV